MLTPLFKFILIGLLITSQTFGQDKIDAKLLQEELVMLGEIASETSPKLTEKERMIIAKLIEQNSKRIDGKPMNTVEFLNFFSSIDMPTKFDEHASIQMSEEVLKPILAGIKLFPLPLKILPERVIVNGANEDLPFGSTIYAINGQPIDSVLSTLSKDLDTFSKRRLEGQFSIIYSFKNPSSDTYTITYSVPSNPNTQQEKQLPGIAFNSWAKKMNESAVYPLNKTSLNELVNTQFYPENEAYYFQLNSFNWDKNSERGLFDKFQSDRKNFDKTFKKIYKEIDDLGAKNLIIDLRYNSGGNIFVPGLLYSYLAQKPFIQHARLEIPDFSFPHEEHIFKLDKKVVQKEGELASFIKGYRSEFQQTESGYFWEIIEKQEQQANKYAFHGNVYLLVGGRSISAASYFTALFKGEKRGTIIGEEIGGSHHSITAGTYITYQLPHTGLLIRVPLMLVNFSDDLYEKVPELKVRPDIELSTDTYYQYFLKKQDPELEEVFRLIKGEN